VKGGDYDLLFLDLKIPEMDGVELLKQIRTVKPEMPVMIITKIHHLIERALISMISFNYKSKENGLGSNI
jgi:DNA-binding response OmpR family regulator